MKITPSRYRIRNTSGDDLYFYLDKRNQGKDSGQLLVLIQGSGRESVRGKFHWGEYFKPLGFDVLYMEKFAYNHESLFFTSDCRERRIADVTFIINYVIQEFYNQSKLSQLLILSLSEGGCIAPEVCLKIKETTQLIVLGSGGYPQAKEFEMLLTKELSSGRKGFFYWNGIFNHKQLSAKFAEIKKAPVVDKFWLGHTYKRWNSYLWYNPENSIRNLEIPALFLIGEEDTSVPQETVSEIRARLDIKSNIRLQTVPMVDHRFNRVDTGENKIRDLFAEIVIPWYLDNIVEGGNDNHCRFCNQDSFV